MISTSHDSRRLAPWPILTIETYCGFKSSPLTMSMEHWQSFLRNQSVKFSDNLPVDSVELERRRRRQDGICSIKSLFCCLSVLLGKPSIRDSSSKSAQRRQQSQVGIIVNYDNDDASFGYNFDEHMSPRVLTRLAGRGHHFDWVWWQKSTEVF